MVQNQQMSLLQMTGILAGAVWNDDPETGGDERCTYSCCGGGLQIQNTFDAFKTTPVQHYRVPNVGEKSHFCYIKPVLYSNSCNLYVICNFYSNSPMQGALMRFTFLATQGWEFITPVVVLHRKSLTFRIFSLLEGSRAKTAPPRVGHPQGAKSLRNI